MADSPSRTHPEPAPFLEPASPVDASLDTALAPGGGEKRRGRPAIRVEERRTYRLNLALSEDELASVRARAALRGRPPSSHAARVVVERLGRFELLPSPDAPDTEVLSAAARQLDDMLREIVASGSGVLATAPREEGGSDLEQLVEQLDEAIARVRLGRWS